MKEKCETCRFWEKWSGREGYGFCHRYPPPVVEEEPEEDSEPNIAVEPYLPEDGRARWPAVSSGEWCGEWKERGP
jgi:hypothetical protein